MSLRMVEIVCDNAGKDRVLAEMRQFDDDRFLSWSAGEDEDDEPLRARVLLDGDVASGLVDRLERRFSGETGFRIVIYPVQATIPRLEPPENNSEPGSEPEQTETPDASPKREGVIREELRAAVQEGAEFTGLFALLATLASVVASIGLLRDNPAVVIGAMVIAPLLGPNVGLALATVLGDARLARASLGTLAGGIALVVAPALALGWLLGADAGSGELAARTVVGLSDVALALAAGVAGIVSLSRGASTALVGVMVALALVPPLSACGLFWGAGELDHAASAGLLALTNVVCLNLAGVLTFAIRGVRPLWYHEIRSARSAVFRALAFWTMLLLAVTAVIVLNWRFF
ncbi:TIGR00341 family protein [Paucidesulfovibrio gracilis DSM 16080]|uniref:TIGR00341 family protein n=1 Tax=Paucidesulfovibrio gracilis DSM 16080 TaxID=1121449 RepID=A0A1T4X8E7_9BACT|nr:TIGR00341 family protein [Paucidesulfovibrio gracilis]SKA85375.1 TIGR00341 family protein [Paucidesulfovibrio gracilis DSM 16080]